MEFTTTTDYDMKTLTAMARALRKTVRKKRSRRAHIFGWIVVLLGTFLLRRAAPFPLMEGRSLHCRLSSPSS